MVILCLSKKGDNVKDTGTTLSRPVIIWHLNDACLARIQHLIETNPMEWVWELYKGYVHKHLIQDGTADPTAEDLEAAFVRLLSESTVTVLVQEPWQNSVRFKGLARFEAAAMLDLLNDPPGYLLAHFGGGKFKLNFHHGWHFVATQNFKPQGPEKWRDLPEIDF